MKVIGKSKRKFIKPRPPAKVYCKNCRWYNEGDFLGVAEHECYAPGIATTKDTPIEVEKIPGNCLELNKHNDCKKYKAKV